MRSKTGGLPPHPIPRQGCPMEEDVLFFTFETAIDERHANTWGLFHETKEIIS